MPVVPKRGVSRARYLRMIEDALTKINSERWALSQSQKLSEDVQKIQTKRMPPVSLEEMLHSRKRPLAFVRFRIYRELHDSGYSYPSIGRAAEKDHTTILSGVRRINAVEPRPEGSIVPRPRWLRPGWVMVEGAAANAATSENIARAEATEIALDPNQSPTSVEIVMGTIAA